MDDLDNARNCLKSDKAQLLVLSFAIWSTPHRTSTLPPTYTFFYPCSLGVDQPRDRPVTVHETLLISLGLLIYILWKIMRMVPSVRLVEYVGIVIHYLAMISLTLGIMGTQLIWVKVVLAFEEIPI